MVPRENLRHTPPLCASSRLAFCFAAEVSVSTEDEGGVHASSISALGRACAPSVSKGVALTRTFFSRRFGSVALGAFLAIALVASTMGATTALAADPSPGDDVITVPINDSHAGGTYQVDFEKVFAGTTDDGTPVYIYVPVGAIGNEDADWMSPSFDPNPNDDFEPCTSDDEDGDHLITQAQIDYLGQQLVDQIVRVDEEHFGPMGAADPTDPNSDSLVMLIYNDLDEAHYVCDTDSYTAGYFSDQFINEVGMNVIVIDSYDWANRIGDQSNNPVGQSELYEGVIAHELEHLLHNYSDPGEDSWVDEGLADFAVFLNGYDVGGSHNTYHQVFHRETSLTRWAGGLENYGASFSFFQYVWEQAGGNGGTGDGKYEPDLEYDDRAGDLLIKMIFEEEANSMEGVQNAIDDFNTATGKNLRSAEELFKDWVIAIYLDDEGSKRFDIRALDFGDSSTTSWTIEMANRVFWHKRGVYTGNMPEPKWQNNAHVPSQIGLPFGTSYETFRNLGDTFKISFSGEDVTQIAPHSGATHWYGGYESGQENVLDVAAAGSLGGQTIDFWTWYFIEEGWDYGYVEALVGGNWVTVPLTNDAGDTVTTNEDPHDENTEGNGLTGTSGGTYFVDEPEYVHLQGTLPAGTQDVRFVYETDQAYLDTGWFIDDVNVGGASAALSSSDWVETNGEQQNDWVVQVISQCDLTPGVDNGAEFIVDGWHIYRYNQDEFTKTGFDTTCLGSKGRFTVAVSNITSGDLQVLDADYNLRVVRQR